MELCVAYVVCSTKTQTQPAFIKTFLFLLLVVVVVFITKNYFILKQTTNTDGGGAAAAAPLIRKFSPFVHCLCVNLRTPWAKRPLLFFQPLAKGIDIDRFWK